MLFKMAYRNVFRHKRRSLLTGLMMAGGCTLFALFMGIISGSYGNLISLFTYDHTGHVQIHSKGYLDKPSIYKKIADPYATLDKLKDLKHIKAMTPRMHVPALAFTGTKTTGLTVTGIDPELEPRVSSIKNRLKEGAFLGNMMLDEILISDRTARVLDAAVGDEVALISQAADGSIANGLFRVKGIIRSDGSVYHQSRLYMDIRVADQFFFLGGGAHEIVVALTSYEKAPRVAQEIKDLLGKDYDSDPWQVVEREFYRAMQADIKGNFVTIIVFTIIISLGVLNTVLMVILERTREFGVMKALGTRPGDIMKLIVLETMFLALLSIIVGNIGGILANLWMGAYGINIPTPIEYGGVLFEKITSNITLKSILFPTSVILVSALIVSLPPAMRAARISPVKAMRDN
jgi:ABC-type lipoprotein release transport system permease subunit